LRTTNSLFDEPWWLDALAPGAWDAVEVENGGRVVARLPYVRRRRGPLTVLTQPGLTQSLGPWLEPSEAKYAKRLGAEKERLTALIEALPPHHVFQQSFAPAITNWLPFYWAGFTATVRYTYRLEDLSDPDAIWSGFADPLRRSIRKAEKQLEVRDDAELEEVLPLNTATYRRQGLPNPAPDELLRRLDAAARANDARRLLVARDAAGQLHGFLYVVHDERTAYYLLSGRDAELPDAGAPSLLAWTAIQAVRETSAAFDFEGSMIEPIERFFRSFGARQTPYFRVQRAVGRLGRLVTVTRGLRS
jgi:hypothetical protein